MGYYSEYLNKQQFDFESLSNERKKQIKIIQGIRERPTLIYASDLNKK